MSDMVEKTWSGDEATEDVPLSSWNIATISKRESRTQTQDSEFLLKIQRICSSF